MLKGRQPYVAVVEGRVDGVPFVNYFKFMKTAEKNLAEVPGAILTRLDSYESYKWDAKREKVVYWCQQ